MDITYFMNAKPIWAKGRTGEKNLTCLFSTRMEKGNYLLRLTACNFYRIWKGGVFFGYGPARAPHGYARVDEYVFSVNSDGEPLVIEVSGYRCRSFYALDEVPFLQAELFAGGKSVCYTAAEGDFVCSVLQERLQKVARFSYQRAFSESYVFLRPPMECYAPLHPVEVEETQSVKLLPRRISYPVYDTAYAVPVECGAFEYGTRGKPFSDRYITLNEIGIFPRDTLETYPSDALNGIKYRSSGRKPICGDGDYEVYAFDNSETGFLRIRASAEAESHFLVIFDEIALNDPNNADTPKEICFDRNACYNIVEYRTAAGMFEHICFEPYTIRYAKIIVLSGRLKIDEVSLIRYENADCKDFSACGGDKKIDQIIDAAVRTFRHNAVDILTDCPSRERAGWLCDSWFTARAEKLFTGHNRIETNFLENIALSPDLPFVPEGMIPMCYPADFSQKDMYIPNWAMWYVLELYDYSLRGGDTSIIALSKDKVYALFRYLEKYENDSGLLEDLEGWIFLEWSKANDPAYVCGVNYPSNMMYFAALKAGGKLFSDATLEDKAARIRSSIREQSFNGVFYEDNAVRAKDGTLERTGHISETCQYYAFFTGIATREEDGALWKCLVDRFGAFRNPLAVYPEVAPSSAFIGNYLRMYLLHEYGYKQTVREESTEFFLKMAERTGTLWEHDDIRGSLDHGFASYIAVLLLM